MSTSPRIPCRPIWRHATIAGRAGIAHYVEHGANGMFDCSLDGEVTLDGRPRHDLWHPSQVVLGERIG